MNRHKTLSSIFVSVIATAPLTSLAQSVPQSGSLSCERLTQNSVPVGGEQKANVSVNQTRCQLDGTDFVSEYLGMVRFDGAHGKLVSGNGFTRLGDKMVQAFRFDTGTWELKIENGKVVSWDGKGTIAINAGQHAGKTMTWTSWPTGPGKTAVKYEIR